jgi:hypothetical protein
MAGGNPTLARCVLLERVLNLINQLQARPPFADAVDLYCVYSVGYRVGASCLLSLASRSTLLFTKIVAVSPRSHIFETFRPTAHSKSPPALSFEGALLAHLQLPLDEGYFAALDLTLIARLHQKVLARASRQDLDALSILPEKCSGTILFFSFESDAV